jgi:hypothetical protein
MSRRCSATTNSGRPCRAWAIASTDPPLCAAHARSGGQLALLPLTEDASEDPARAGVPRPSLGVLLKSGADGLFVLTRVIAWLVDYIDLQADALSPAEAARLARELGQLLVHFVKLVGPERGRASTPEALTAQEAAEIYEQVGEELGQELWLENPD